MTPVTIAVQGQPRTFASNEGEWRKLIADKCESVDMSTRDMVNGLAVVEVAMLFQIHKSRIRGMDLDNLAKPVMDTLFSCHPTKRSIAKHPTACLTTRDDHIVSRLVIERRLVEDEREEGVIITVSQMESVEPWARGYK